MANGDTRLPEGTDHIIGGASVGTDLSSTGGLSSTAPGFDDPAGFGATPPTRPAPETVAATARETLDEARARVGEKTGELREQAAEKVRGYALLGRDRAVESLDNIQQLINDAADTVEAKVGAQYGDYIRQAGASVTTLTDSLRDRNVDDLVDDARALVRKNPGVAIGAATAIGFLLARVAKAGVGAAQETAPVTGGVTPLDTARTSAPGSRPTA